MTDVIELKRLIALNQTEMREQKIERRQEFEQLADMIKNLSIIQGQNNDKTTENLGIVIQKQDTMEKRLDKIENGGAAMGGDSFIERHKTLIEQAKYGIKVLGMPGKVTEENA